MQILTIPYRHLLRIERLPLGQNAKSHQVALQLRLQWRVELVQIQPPFAGDLDGHQFRLRLARLGWVVQVDLHSGDQPVLRQRARQLFSQQVGDAAVLACRHGRAVKLQLVVRAEQADRFHLQHVEAVGLRLRHIKSQPQRRQIERRCLQTLRIESCVQQMFGERLEQHLVVFGPALDQRAGDAGACRVLQHRVDVGVADAALEVIPLEFQLDRRQVLDVDAQQENAGAALHDVGLAAVTALQLALVEGRNIGAQCGQGGIRCVGDGFDAQVMLLGVGRLALEVIHITGTVKQFRVLDVQPERAMDVALACGQCCQGSSVTGGHLEHGLRSGRIAKSDTGTQFGGHRVAHGHVRAAEQCRDQGLRGLGLVSPSKVVRHLQPMARQELTQGGVHGQLTQQVDPGFFHVGGPFRGGVGGLRTEVLVR
ncbi:hypothetical protein FERRO_01520 [Ferrovum sp. JA12]|nr:hypothetical protein FERRO_01520 [Ferrovum sp. JA12]